MSSELAALRAASLCAVWAVQALRNTSFAFHRQCEQQRYALLVVLNSGSTTEKARQKWQKGFAPTGTRTPDLRLTTSE